MEFTTKYINYSKIGLKLKVEIESTNVECEVIEKPFFDYCVETKKIAAPFSNEKNITVMSIDNLPSELPRDSSRYFGNLLLEKIIPLLSDDKESILEKATITKDGDLCKKYEYLRDFIN